MKQRKWDSKTKFLIVLEGLKSKNISQLCNQHQISQTQYYKWRDKFLENGFKAFDVNADKEKERLKSKVKKLNSIIGSLTVELKKNDEELL
jgi:transposase-like protein